MQIGTYADGRALSYDEGAKAFDAGGTPVTVADVIGYDRAGQVDWLSDELRDWAQGLAATLGAQGPSTPVDSSPQVADTRPGRLFGFRSKRPWKMAIASLYYATCAIAAIGAVASVKPYATSPRDVVLDVLSYVLVVLALLSPAFLLSDFGYRQKLPFFKRRKLKSSVAGLAVVFLLLSVSVAFADSLHSQPYKVAAEKERVALQQEQDADQATQANAKKTAEDRKAAEAKAQSAAQRSAEASKAAEATKLAAAQRSADASRAAEAQAQAAAQKSADATKAAEASKAALAKTRADAAAAKREAAVAAVSAAESEYAGDVAEITGEVSDASSELSGILQDDPSGVFTDQDTRMKVVVQMAMIKTGYPRVKALKPPARLRPAHADMLAAMKLYDRAMTKFAQGIDSFDAGKVTDATALMSKAGKRMQAATRRVEALAR